MLIGLPPDLAAQIAQLRPPSVEITVTDRPGEAMRRFDAESPDVVILGVGPQPEQSALLLQALRDRPLGALVPVALVDSGQSPQHPLTTPAGASEAGADRYFTPGTPATQLLHGVAELVGMEFKLPGLPQSAAPRTAPEISLARPEEPISQETPTRKVRNPGSIAPEGGPEEFQPADRSDRMRPSHPWDPQARVEPYQPHSLQTPSPDAYSPRYTPRPSSAAMAPQEVTAELIRLKLRQVRHEDYFSILDLRKSAEVHQIEQSFQALRRRFEPSRLPAQLADRYHNELREICEALEDGFAVLGSPELRDGYLRALLHRQQPG